MSKKSDYLANLKKYKWFQWKASRLRSDWLTRAKKIKADISTVPTRVEIQEWLENNKPFICYLSNEKIIKSLIELDHRIPTSRGGSFRLNNIGITTKKLNSIKGNMTEKEFLELLELVNTWDDKGESLFKRLRNSNNIYRKK